MQAGIGGCAGSAPAARLRDKLAGAQVVRDEHRDDVPVEHKVEHGRPRRGARAGAARAAGAGQQARRGGGCAEVDVEQVLQRGLAGERDAERAPDPAARAVRGHQKVGSHLARTALRGRAAVTGRTAGVYVSALQRTRTDASRNQERNISGMFNGHSFIPERAGAPHAY